MESTIQYVSVTSREALVACPMEETVSFLLLFLTWNIDNTFIAFSTDSSIGENFQL